jgi:hypothetical protein
MQSNLNIRNCLLSINLQNVAINSYCSIKWHCMAYHQQLQLSLLRDIKVPANQTSRVQVCEFFYFSRWTTMKLTFEVNEFRGYLSSLEVALIKSHKSIKMVQIRPFLFELYAVFYCFRCMTLKMTWKVTAFWGHLFPEGSPCPVEQNETNFVKVQRSVFVLFELLT